MKKIYKKVIAVIVILLVSVNCENKYKKVYYVLGNKLKYKYQYIVNGKDTIPNGEFYEYYPNGNLKMKTSYDKGLKHGIIHKYYETGEVKISAHVTNNKYTGIFKEYYLNGLIKKYAGNDMYGNTHFIALYDSLNSSVIGTKGKHLIQIDQPDSLKSGKALKIDALIATPPMENLSFAISYIHNKEQDTLNYKKCISYPIVNNLIKIDTVLNMKGVYDIEYKVVVFDSLQKIDKQEKVNSSLIVY